MRQLGQRAIFWPLPLRLGVSTSSTSPCSDCTRSDSISALSANAVPVSRWHQRQWQQCTNSGLLLIRKRTARQVQPPSKPESSRLVIVRVLAGGGKHTAPRPRRERPPSLAQRQRSPYNVY